MMFYSLRKMYYYFIQKYKYFLPFVKEFENKSIIVQIKAQIVYFSPLYKIPA